MAEVDVPVDDVGDEGPVDGGVAGAADGGDGGQAGGDGGVLHSILWTEKTPLAAEFRRFLEEQQLGHVCPLRIERGVSFSL